MGSINVTIGGSALKMIDKARKIKKLSYSDFITDSISTYAWIMDEISKGNDIISIDKITGNKKRFKLGD